MADVPGRESETGVDRPIFVVGSGRSGTTLLYRMIVGHEDLAWVTRLTNNLPWLPQLSCLSLGRRALRSRLLGPSLEGIKVYRRAGMPSLAEKRASLTEEDVTDGLSRRLRSVFAAHCRWMKRPRFTSKNTNNTMRVRLLRAIFPDAFFVHIIRNGYAVASSLCRSFFWKSLTPWWLGKNTQQWEAEGRCPFELAAMHWKRQVSEILTHKEYLPADQYHELRYERLVEEPEAVIREIADLTDLPWTPAFQEHVRSVRAVPSTKDKWRDQLGDAQRESIRRAAGETLAALGYAEEPA